MYYNTAQLLSSKLSGKDYTATDIASVVITGMSVVFLGLILLVLFVAALAITRYMSVGSILLMIELAVAYIIFGLKGMLCFDMSVPASKTAFIESAVLVVLFAGLAIFKHKANIQRLINHEENKFHFKKQEGV
jgi:glycerol-3-phosphate acyltransferase PlsY